MKDMKIEVTLEKRSFFVIIGALLVLAGVIGVIAFVQGPGNYPNPGHPLECVTGSYNDDTDMTNGVNKSLDLNPQISVSSTGVTYTFDNVFTASLNTDSDSGNVRPVLDCKDGWAMTGCGSFTFGDTTGDSIMKEKGCIGDSRGENSVMVRCCKIQ